MKTPREWLNDWAARESAANDTPLRENDMCPDCRHPHLPMLEPYRLETGHLVVQECSWPAGPEPCDCVRLTLDAAPGAPSRTEGTQYEEYDQGDPTMTLRAAAELARGALALPADTTCVFCNSPERAGPCFGGDRCMAAALDNRVRRIIERTANMGSCSQTHHEHLARDAARVDAALAASVPLGSETLIRFMRYHESLQGKEGEYVDGWDAATTTLITRLSEPQA